MKAKAQFNPFNMSVVAVTAMLSLTRQLVRGVGAPYDKKWSAARLPGPMARVTAGAVALAVVLLPSFGPAGSPLPPTGTAWAATRSVAPVSAIGAASGPVRVTAVAGGLYHGLGLSSSGAVLAWGWNIVGQLGNGNTHGSDVPATMKLPGGTRVVRIAAGYAHSLAVTSTGVVFSCGKNYNGQLGDGTTTDRDMPVKVSLPAGPKVTAVAAGADHSLAVTSTGAVFAWGLNNEGQLGNGGTGSSAVPVKVTLPAGTRVTAVAAGALHNLALTSTGAVLAWGYNAMANSAMAAR